MNKEILKQWGENTAYSAKSHYKTSDLKRLWIKTLLIINVLFALLSVLDFQSSLMKILSVVSLIASILILIYESNESKNSVLKHMSIGDEYLNIHYELQKLFNKGFVSEQEIESVSEKMEKINSKEKPIISQLAKKWAKKSIEKDNEMIKWWK